MKNATLPLSPATGWAAGSPLSAMGVGLVESQIIAHGGGESQGRSRHRRRHATVLDRRSPGGAGGGHVALGGGAGGRAAGAGGEPGQRGERRDPGERS